MSTITVIAELTSWLQNVVVKPVSALEPLTDCASTRAYFRARFSDKSLVVMHSPPTTEKNAAFIEIAELLEKAGFVVPKIIAYDLERGFLLVSDLGDNLLGGHLVAHNVDVVYGKALDTLLQLQTHQQLNGHHLPAYDADFILRELTIFREWYLQKHLNMELTSHLETQLIGVFNILVESALAQPAVFMHRDYHSQNLILLNDKVGILDFQDAVRGPITYDLVSLVRDCYVAWPQTQVEQWVLTYFQRAQQLGLVSSNSVQFLKWFDLMGLQRHLKVLGIFVRVASQQNKTHYLQHIPRVLQYIQYVCMQYSELKPLLNLFSYKPK